MFEGLKNLLNYAIEKDVEIVFKAGGVDKVTGFLCRDAFDAKILELIIQASRESARICLALFEIDQVEGNQKPIRQRDLDRGLKEVSAVIKECARRRNEFVYRYDVNKIAVLVHDMNTDHFKKMVNNIRLKVVRSRIEHVTLTDKFLTVSAGGIVFWPASFDAEVVVQLLNDRALSCLQESKDRPVNCEVIEELGTMPAGYKGSFESFAGCRRRASD